jgi:hypothetical protein
LCNTPLPTAIQKNTKPRRKSRKTAQKNTYNAHEKSIKPRSKNDQNKQSALVPRLHPRFAVNQKTATQRHSPCGVNRGAAAIEHNAPLRKIAPFANRVLSVGQSRVTRRYVLRPATSAKPIRAPEGAGIWSGKQPALVPRLGPCCAGSQVKSHEKPTPTASASGASRRVGLHRTAQRVLPIAVKAKPCGRARRGLDGAGAAASMRMERLVQRQEKSAYAGHRRDLGDPIRYLRKEGLAWFLFLLLLVHEIAPKSE